MALFTGWPGNMPEMPDRTSFVERSGIQGMPDTMSGERQGVSGTAGSEPGITSIKQSINVPSTLPVSGRTVVGFHKTITGSSSQTPADWYDVAKNASCKFEGAGTGAVWVIGCAQADGLCYLNFPSSKKYSNVLFSNTDENEHYLDYFDKKGMSVILQVEPGQADVDQVIRLVLDRYGHHPCVAGLGVDVEWLRFGDYAQGRPVTDEEAARWYDLVRSYDPGYKLALTHWMTEKMPPTYRDGLYFLYDGEGFTSLDDMIAKCVSWSHNFPDNPVGFYIGFPSDQAWWGRYDDPLYTIGERLLKNIENTRGIYWFNGRHP